MKLIGIDSSGMTASVAILEDDLMVAEYSVNYKKTHSQTLLPMLDEIVKMVGMDALSPGDRMKLEAARSVREDYLHQNAFHEVDTYTSPQKQFMMLKAIMTNYEKNLEALDKDASFRALMQLPVRERIGRLKYVPEAEAEDEYNAIMKDMTEQITALTEGGQF